MATPIVLHHESDVVDRLRKRFPPPAWVMFQGVSNATGSRGRRWADAVAMSIWPSRGLEIYGFEVKVSRRDMLKELKHPDKAEEIAKYCDKWWIAVGSKDVVKPEELPPAWGLLVPSGSTMKIARDAKKTKAKATDRDFTASVLRRAHEFFDVDRIRRDAENTLYKTISEKVEERYKDDLERHKLSAEEAHKKLDELRGQIQLASNELITPDTFGKLLRIHRTITGWKGSSSLLDQAEVDLLHTTKTIDEAVKSLAKVKDLVDSIKGDE